MTMLLASLSLGELSSEQKLCALMYASRFPMKLKDILDRNKITDIPLSYLICCQTALLSFSIKRLGETKALPPHLVYI